MRRLLEKVPVKMCVAALTVLTMTATGVPALATDPQTTTTTSISTILNGMVDVTDLCTAVWQLLTSNSYFTFFLCVGLLGSGIGVFVRIKRAARR